MRDIDVQEITLTVERLCIQANVVLPETIKRAFAAGKEAEKSPVGQSFFSTMIENYETAERKQLAVCQDTGMAMVFCEIGQEIHFTGGDFEQAVNEGVRRGYQNGYLRLSVVKDPLFRENTNDNTPAIIHVRLVPGDKVKITVAPKGFGSENMTTLKMFTPSATREEIMQFIVQSVDRAGSNPCPPVIVGVGLGGTADHALLLSKEALLREIGSPAENDFYQTMENDMLEHINRLGIGPQGLGGTVTALAVHIRPFATHIAGLPCAVSIGCHVTRHATEIL